LHRYPAETQQLLHGFATWHHLRRIRQLSTVGTLTPGTIRTAKQEITVAAELLTHLHTNSIATGALAQADLDAWLASGPSTRYTARTFVRWAVATRRLPALTFPHRQTRSSATLDQQQRPRLLNSCFGQATAPVAHRVAGILLLLYAQPVTRISRLRTADINDTGHDMVITFDTDAVPVPAPIAQLLRQHLRRRPNMQTAANATSPWLFPGSRAGQPLTADRMNHQLRNLGIPLRQARNSALRQLVQDMPPPSPPEPWVTASPSSNTTPSRQRSSSTATPPFTAISRTRPNLAAGATQRQGCAV
jgi:site-specific recombinase XerD